jgi:hypothetical protein
MKNYVLFLFYEEMTGLVISSQLQPHGAIHHDDIVT